MANVKISALPAATSVAAADVLPIVQSATTKEATFTDGAGAVGGVRVYASAAARNSAMASPAEGMCVYLTDEDTLQIYTGSAWVAIGATKTVSGVSDGLVYVTSQTIGSAVSSVTISNCFSSAYDNYKIVLSNTTGSTSLDLRFQLSGLTTSVYNQANIYVNTSSTVTGYGVTLNTYTVCGGADTGNANSFSIDVYGPFASTRTSISGHGFFLNGSMLIGCQAVDTNSRTGFVISTSTGTITGGTISVYGYRKA